MRAFLDLQSKTFGRLIVIAQDGYKLYPSGQRHPKWLCKCECGNMVSVVSKRLTAGETKSCGCYRRDKNKSHRPVTHDMSRSRLYRIYYGMITRCEDQKAQHYRLYGGKGIAVCPEWRSSFVVFMEWALENGYDECLSIDRIDNSKDYSPSNCRWVTPKEQILHRF